MENVKALVSKKFRSDYNKWEQYLAGLGYDNYCKVLNAKDYGVPQNRERIFIVSVLGDYDTFSFPLPFRLKLRLKDVLEDKVDDRYVLSDEIIEGFLKHNENHLAKGTGFLWEPKDLETDGGGVC